MNRDLLRWPVKRLVAFIAAKAGLSMKYRKPVAVEFDSSELPTRWTEGIAQTILDFYTEVPPLYDDAVPLPLQIAGAWREFLLATRKQQLSAIANRDADAYARLIGNLFQSELITGLWAHAVFGLSHTVPPSFLADLENFEVETGRSREDLVAGEAYRGEWGLGSKANRVIRYVDADHGRQAHRVLMALDYLAIPNPVVTDIGSGIGGMARYLALWSKKPITIILIDIPLNLTSAFAALSRQLSGIDVTLIKDRAMLRGIACAEDSTKTRVICVPSSMAGDTIEFFKPTILNNAASFSEMDMVTLTYYMGTLVTDETLAVIESNTAVAGSVNNRGFVDLTIDDIETLLRPDFAPVARSRTPNTIYVTSTYLRRNINSSRAANEKH